MELLRLVKNWLVRFLSCNVLLIFGVFYLDLKRAATIRAKKALQNKSEANKTESAKSLEETGVSSKQDGNHMMF